MPKVERQVPLQELSLIVNGNSGKQTLRKIFRRDPESIAAKIKREAEKRGIVVDLHVTANLEDAKKAIAEITARNSKFIGIVGGDGTVRNVLTRLYHEKYFEGDDTPVIIPFGGGSVNVLRKGLGIPRTIRGFFRALDSGKIKLHDVYLGTVAVGDKPKEVFASNVTAGFSGDVFKADRSKGQRGGAIGYAKAAIDVVNHPKYIVGDIHVKGKNGGMNRRHVVISDMFVHKGNNFGRFRIRRSVMPGDDAFQVIVHHGRSTPRRNALAEASAIGMETVFGMFTSSQDRIRGEHIIINNTNQPIDIQADGDGLGKAYKVEIDLLAAHVKMASTRPTLSTSH